MNKVFVLGGTQTDFERNWTKEKKSIQAMFQEVVEDGFDSINLPFEDFESLKDNLNASVFVGSFASELYTKQGHLGAMLTEISPVFNNLFSARYEAACASGSIALDAAITKIKAGETDFAIVIGVESMKTVDAKIGGDYLGTAAHYDNEAAGIDFPFPKLFGQLADFILEKYKLDEKKFMDALAAISNKNFQNAKRNPKAQTRKWFMNSKHACKRYNDFNASVGNKLAITDCSQITDGAAIVFLASEKGLKELQSKLQPTKSFPLIKGRGITVAPFRFEDKQAQAKDANHVLPWTVEAVNKAYNEASLTVNDMDVFETHDCFTSSEFAHISAFGITKPGDEIKAIEDGTITFDGSKPINPSGGLIGVGHPVGASGVRMMLDLYKQITNQAGSYQIEGAKNGLMLNIGGSATTNCVFIIGT